MFASNNLSLKGQPPGRRLKLDDAKVKVPAFPVPQVLPLLLPGRPEVAPPRPPPNFQQVTRLTNQVVSPAATKRDVPYLPVSGMEDCQPRDGNRRHLN